MQLRSIGLKQNIKKEIIDWVKFMEEFTDQDFKEFMESYKNGTFTENNEMHKFHDSLTELSRSGTEDADALIFHSQKMYGLDWIVKGSKRLNKTPPKTTDALYFRIDDNGNMKLHIIEFKFIGYKSYRIKFNNLCNEICCKISCDGRNLDDDECLNKNFLEDLKLIKNTFQDPIDISFQLKPYEAIFITLPELYKEYCQENGFDEKDIKTYLANIKKYYWIVIRNDNMAKQHLKSIAKHFDRYNARLEGSIFTKARAKTDDEFYKVLKREILNDFKGEIT